MTSPTPPQRSGYRWWVLASVLLVNVVVVGFAWNYVIMLVPELLADLSLEIADWGVLWAGISLGVCLFAVLAGALADRYGVRTVIGGGLLAMAAALLLRAELHGLVPMFCAMVLFGITLGAVFPNLPKALGLYFPAEQLGFANGLAFAGVGLGFSVVGLGTPGLAEHFGDWRELTRATGWATGGLGLLWLLSIRDVPLGETAEEEVPTLVGIRRVLKVRGVWVLAACYLLFNASDLTISGYIATFLKEERAMEAEAAGLFVSVASWGFIFGSFLLPTLSDRIGRRKPVFILGMSATGLSLLGFTAFTGVPLYAVGAFYALCQGAITLTFILPLEMDPPGARLAGSAVGVAVTGGFAGGVIGPVIGMRLVAIDPIVGFAFWCLCFLMAAALFATLRETGPAARSTG